MCLGQCSSKQRHQARLYLNTTSGNTGVEEIKV